MKLLTKIGLIIVVLAIPVVIVISFLSYTFTKSSLEKAIADQQLEFALQTMDKIDRLLYERYNDMLTIGGDDIIERFLINSSLPANNKDPVFNNVKERISELSLVTGPWDELVLIDSGGKIVYSNNTIDIGKSAYDTHLEDTEILKKTLRGESNYSDVVRGEKTQKPTMIFASPIRNINDPEKPVVGIVIGHLSWKIVLELLHSSKTRETELLNSRGIKLGSSKSEDVGEVLNEDASKDQIIQKAIQGQEGSEVVGVNSHEQFLESYVRERGHLQYKGNNWILAIKTPVGVAFSEVNNAALVLPTIFTLAVAVATILTLFFVNKLAIEPLKLLTRTTQEIAQGDLTKRVSISSKDETGVLAKSFNQMTDKLQELYQGLEEKVKERTMQLHAQIEEEERMNKLMLGRELKMIALKEEINRLKGEKAEAVKPNDVKQGS